MKVSKHVIFCGSPFVSLIFAKILITFCGIVFGFKFSELNIEIRVMVCVVTLMACFVITVVNIVDILEWLSSDRKQE